MPRKDNFPPHPSFLEFIPFPTFTISWKDSKICYAGGGGSAKTGVCNKIIVLDNAATNSFLEIDTKECICAAAALGGNNLLAAGVDNILKIYNTTDGSCIFEEMSVTKSCINAVAFSKSEKILGVGCDDGSIEFWDVLSKKRLSVIENGHSKAVCAVSISYDDLNAVSGGKDGTARVWNVSTGEALCILNCTLSQEEMKKKKLQLLVRGCKYISDGSIFTIVSSRRGNAYLSKWLQGQELSKICCSNVPISSMDISHDAAYFTLGAVDGSITVIDIATLKVIRRFHEIHDLPVTCIAARPLQISEEHENIVAISASADNKMAFLSLHNPSPKKSFYGWMMDFWIIIFIGFFSFILKLCFYECQQELQTWDLIKSKECFRSVLIADETVPGIMIPPH